MQLCIKIVSDWLDSLMVLSLPNRTINWPKLKMELHHPSKGKKKTENKITKWKQNQDGYEIKFLGNAFVLIVSIYT